MSWGCYTVHRGPLLPYSRFRCLWQTSSAVAGAALSSQTPPGSPRSKAALGNADADSALPESVHSLRRTFFPCTADGCTGWSPYPLGCLTHPGSKYTSKRVFGTHPVEYLILLPSWAVGCERDKFHAKAFALRLWTYRTFTADVRLPPPPPPFFFLAYPGWSPPDCRTRSGWLGRRTLASLPSGPGRARRKVLWRAGMTRRVSR